MLQFRLSGWPSDPLPPQPYNLDAKMNRASLWVLRPPPLTLAPSTPLNAVWLHPNLKLLGLCNPYSPSVCIR